MCPDNSYSYTIKYKNGLDGLESGIYEGMDAVRRNMSMPLGKEMYNHTIFIYVSISDSLGAFTTAESRIKVNIFVLHWRLDAMPPCATPPYLAARIYLVFHTCCQLS